MTSAEPLPANDPPYGVQLLHVVSAAEYPPAGGAFVWNTNGLGKLRWCAAAQGDACRTSGPYDDFLMLDDVPLLQRQSENGCPTCDQLLQAGDTPADQLEQSAVAINALKNNTPIADCLVPLAPVIQLLRTGLYFVAFDDYSPTNGEGRFFWRAFGELRASRPLAFHVLYHSKDPHKPDTSSNRPIFLAPTQSTAKFSLERFNAARLTYQEAPGLAIYLHGRLSALLDGHHRATCAAMNGVRFRALTITEAHVADRFQRQVGLCALGIEVPRSQLAWKNRAWLNKQLNISHETIKQDTIDVATCHAMLQRVVWPELPKQITAVINPEIYPNDQQCSLLAQFQNRNAQISDEVIKNVLDGNCDHLDDRLVLEELLEALFAVHDPRAVETAMHVAQSPGWARLWENAYQLLSTIRSEEVENQLVQFLVDDDGNRPEIKAIVDRYFEAHD